MKQGLRARLSPTEDAWEEEVPLRPHQLPLHHASPHRGGDGNDKGRRRASAASSNNVSSPVKQGGRRGVWIRWRLLSPCSRALILILGPLLLLHVAVGTVDLCFHYYKYGFSADASSHGSSLREQDENSETTSTITDTANESFSSSSFAVVINTYKRPQQLQQAVQHYADRCGKRVGIDQIFIVWAEQGVTPPSTASLFRTHTSSLRTTLVERNRPSVEILAVDKDSLNSRFLPIESLQSRAVFMVDDDIQVDCPSLYQGFLAWKANPDSMVGYYPRLSTPGRGDKQQAAGDATRTSASKLVYYSWPSVFYRHEMNFILTKASFFHRRYLDLYSDSKQHPPEILDYVDKYMNCEDIAMSMLVANVTRAEAARSSSSSSAALPAMPIYVQGSVADQGLFGGISTGGGHMKQRSQCLVDLSNMYKEHGWEPEPLQHVFDLTSSSWIQHAPGWKWQYRPSNFFEWFALGNIWK